MSVARDVANALVQSGFWPGVNPHAVLTLCFLAEAEGHHPAVVYRDYHIMNGKPSKKAEAILRDFAAAGGKIEWHKLDDKCADATFTHPSGQARIEWTLERANKAGLKSPMWNKYPRQMLRSRCISEGVRTVFPGATSGLYETNEVADIVAEDNPANDTPPEPEVQQGAVKAKPKPANNDGEGQPFPPGPCKNITGLKNELRAIWHEVTRCGDEDELDIYLDQRDIKAVIEQAKKLSGTWGEVYYGDGKDNPGLQGHIEKRRAQIRTDESLNDFIPERNPIAAG